MYDVITSIFSTGKISFSHSKWAHFWAALSSWVDGFALWAVTACGHRVAQFSKNSKSQLIKTQSYGSKWKRQNNFLLQPEKTQNPSSHSKLRKVSSCTLHGDVNMSDFLVFFCSLKQRYHRGAWGFLINASCQICQPEPHTTSACWHLLGKPYPSHGTNKNQSWGAGCPKSVRVIYAYFAWMQRV